MSDDDQISTINPSHPAALTKEENADFLKSILTKNINSLAGQNSVMMAALSPIVMRRVEVLKEIQCVHDDLESAYRDELAALESKYFNMYEPLYTKRFEIVNGIVEVDGVSKEEVSRETDVEEIGIPDFWLTALSSNEIVCWEIDEGDRDALKFLNDIKWRKLDNANGFKLDFFFDNNPFFSNSVLTKTYHMTDDDEPTLEKATGTVIDWYPGKNLCDKPTIEGSDETSKDEQTQSFFKFFSPVEVPTNLEELDDDSASELQDTMEQDFEVGYAIREKIITHAVSWFTGEAIQDDDIILELDEEEITEDEDEASEGAEASKDGGV